MQRSTKKVYQLPIPAQRISEPVLICLAGMDERLLLAAAKQRNVKMFALMPKAPMKLEECDFNQSCAIITGSEGRGVSARLSAKAMDVRIPTLGVESLNAALAAGIALYAARKQRMSAS